MYIFYDQEIIEKHYYFTMDFYFIIYIGIYNLDTTIK